MELKHQRRFISGRLKAGKPVPDEDRSILETPWVSKTLLPFWKGFAVLHQSRSYHMGGPNPISVSDIVSYRREFFRKAEAETFLTAVHSLDSIFLDDYAKKSENGKKGIPSEG